MSRIAFVTKQRDELDSVMATLHEERNAVETYGNAKFALESFLRRMPDLIVISRRLPQIESDNITHRLRISSVVPIVILTHSNDEIDEIMCLRSGVDAYIHLPISPRLLCERIKGILRRRAVQLTHQKMPADREKVIECGSLTIDLGRYKVFLNKIQADLTLTEFQLLHALVRRPGIVKSRDQLISEFQTEEACIDDRVIDSHIKRIRRKLRAIDPKFSGIQTLYGVGYSYLQPIPEVRNATDLGPAYSRKLVGLVGCA